MTETNKIAGQRSIENAIKILSAIVLTSSFCASKAAESNSSQAEIGPIRLQQNLANQQVPGTKTVSDERDTEPLKKNRQAKESEQIAPSEFEKYVQRATNSAILLKRFGSELATPEEGKPVEQDTQQKVPLDYIISIGDEIQVTLWGGVDADIRTTVDRHGRITIPRIGPILVAGLAYADLNNAIIERAAQVFKNFKVSATLGKLRNIRIYVTGFAQKPGAYTTSALATLHSALIQAGGPSSAGSFRNLELRRNGKTVSRVDLYDLLIYGNKTSDKQLQAEDVIHVNAAGPQVAMIGSVNKPAIFEILPHETIQSVISMAGGFTDVADQTRISLEQLNIRNKERIREATLPKDINTKPEAGDILRAFSAVEVAMPQLRQSKRIKIEGEVQRPGEYILPPESSINDAIKIAGGLTQNAYVFGSNFSRESVRASQQENYERALRDLETEFARTNSSHKTTTAEDAAAQNARSLSSNQLIQRLRMVTPTGRIVLQLDHQSKELPDLALEDGDRLHIPARPNTVGVFGSVFNAGSYLYKEGATAADFLQLAGGPTRGADTDSVFVVRANGSVTSSRQKSGWLFKNGNLDGLNALPGDTLFVPEEMNKTTFAQEAKEWTQILYQFGIGAAALKTIKN